MILPDDYRLKIARTAAEVAAELEAERPELPGAKKKRIAVAEGMRRLRAEGMDRATHAHAVAALDRVAGLEPEPQPDEDGDEDEDLGCCDPRVWAVVRQLLLLAIEAAVQAWRAGPR